MSIRQDQGSNWIRRTTRLAIYARDGFKCAYCGCKLHTGKAGRKAKGSKMATLDHVIARSCGGTNAPSNLVASCVSCNSSKGDAKLNDAVCAFLFNAKIIARITARLELKLDRAEGRRLAALNW